MKKIILLIGLALFCLTGCTAEYTVDISNEYIYTEKTVATAPKSKEADEKVNFRTMYPLISIYEDSFKKKYYTQKNLSTDTTSAMSFEYKYSNKTYPKSMALQMCYDVHGLVMDEDTVLLQTSEIFKCFDTYPELTEVTVHVKCPFKVIRNNADQSDHEVYTWKITKENAGNKPIMLEFERNKKAETKKESNNKMLDMILVGCGCIFLAIGVIYLIGVYSKNKGSNKL